MRGFLMGVSPCFALLLLLALAGLPRIPTAN